MISISRRTDELVVLIAEDDEDDFSFLEEAVKECNISTDVRWVKDGEEALDYIFRRDSYADPESSPRPDLIFLDICMPKKSGLDIVPEIKDHPDVKRVPVVMVTTSGHYTDVNEAYEKGANSYIKKPVGISQMDEFKKLICSYWSPLCLIP
jgi:CheY-like chemotaxis protein